MTSAEHLPIADAARWMRAGEVSVAEYVEPFARAIEEKAHLNAFITADPAALRKAAHALDQNDSATAGPPQPLHGIPFGVKDNIDTTAMATSGGTPALKGRIPKHNAATVDLLLAAGALLAGKTNLHELACGVTCNNAAFGPVRNPYDPECIPGGSSGGTAAAIAAGMIPVGLGTDTGGSVRIPAALCGVVGLRPTAGRYPGAGLISLSPTRDSVGVLGRTVADVATLDAVMAGDAGAHETTKDVANLDGLRLGLPRGYFFDHLDRDLEAVIEAALERLAEAGVELVETDIPDLAQLAAPVSFPLVAFELPRGLAAYLTGNDYDLSVADLIEAIATGQVKDMCKHFFQDKPTSPEFYAEIRRIHRPRLVAAFQAYFDGGDLDGLIVPTTPVPAKPIGEDDTIEVNGQTLPTFPTYIRNADAASGAGLPAISVPAGLTLAGLPVGLEIQAPQGADRRLLAMAAAVERIMPDLPPPL